MQEQFHTEQHMLKDSMAPHPTNWEVGRLHEDVTAHAQVLMTEFYDADDDSEEKEGTIVTFLFIHSFLL